MAPRFGTALVVKVSGNDQIARIANKAAGFRGSLQTVDVDMMVVDRRHIEPRLLDMKIVQKAVEMTILPPGNMRKLSCHLAVVNREVLVKRKMNDHFVRSRVDRFQAGANKPGDGLFHDRHAFSFKSRPRVQRI